MPKKLPALKPCPFCGAKRVYIASKGGGFFWAVECSNGACWVVGPWRKTERGAINAWNRRKGDE